MKLAFKKSKYLRPLAVIAALLVVLMAQPALAITTTWTGSSGNWTDPSKWTPSVPVANDVANLIKNTNTTATLNTVTPLLNLVRVSGTGNATFTLRQSSGSTALNATNEVVGHNGKGVYNQSNGSNTITRTLTLGNNANGNGTYNKSGGNLSAGAMVVGRAGTGLFKLSSSKASVGTFQPDGTEPFSVIIGGLHNSGSPIDTGVGEVNISSSTFTVDGGEVVGQEGQGKLNVSSSTHTVGGYFIVGNWDGSVGEAKISSSTFKVGLNEHIGDTGTGKMTLSSSSHEIGGDLFVGKFTGSKGDLISSSSSILVKGNATIGGAGPGTFTASSSSITVDGDYTLGDNASGTQTLSSSSLKVKGNEVIGNNGPATFTSSSSSNSAKTITIGGAPATYTLNNSSMTATDPLAPANAIWIKGPYTPTSPTDPISTTGGNLLIKGTSTVNGNVTNDGLIKTTSATVTWNGTVINNSAYISDPSTQTFKGDLEVTSTGYIVGLTSQDVFIFENDFKNQSDAGSPPWQTAVVTAGPTITGAKMMFVTGADALHDLYIPGVNLGQGADATARYTNNYGWGALDITGQTTINMKDGNTINPSTGLYVGGLIGVSLDLTDPLNPFAINLTSDSVMDLYFDPADITNNQYLIDAINASAGGVITYSSGGGGIYPYHTPLPPSVLLMGSGLLGLGLLGWRRRRLKG